MKGRGEEEEGSREEVLEGGGGERVYGLGLFPCARPDSHCLRHPPLNGRGGGVSLVCNLWSGFSLFCFSLAHFYFLARGRPASNHPNNSPLGFSACGWLPDFPLPHVQHKIKVGQGMSAGSQRNVNESLNVSVVFLLVLVVLPSLSCSHLHPSSCFICG